MDLREYTKFVKEMTLPTANNLEYGVLNLAAEAGEVAGVYAKFIRDSDLSMESYAEFTVQANKELGDTIFMVVHTCNQLGLDVEKVISDNVEKLRSRRNRGVIQGSGNER